MENVKDANLVISGDLVKNPIASIDSFPDVLAAVLLAGCCGRGLWYSSPSSRCDVQPPAYFPYA